VRQTSNARVLTQKSVPKANVLRPPNGSVKNVVYKTTASVVTKVSPSVNLTSEAVPAAASNGVNLSEVEAQITLGDPDPVEQQLAPMPETVVTQTLLVQEPVAIASPAVAYSPDTAVMSVTDSPVKDPAMASESRAELWSTLNSSLQTFESQLDECGKCCANLELIADMKSVVAGMQAQSSALAKEPIGKLCLSYAAEGKLKLQYQEAQQEEALQASAEAVQASAAEVAQASAEAVQASAEVAQASAEVAEAPASPPVKDHGSGCYAGCKRLLTTRT